MMVYYLATLKNDSFLSLFTLEHEALKILDIQILGIMYYASFSDIIF